MTNRGIPCAKLITSLLLGSYNLVGFLEMWLSKNGQSYIHHKNDVTNSGRLLFDNCSLFLAKCESTWLISRNGYRTQHDLELIIKKHQILCAFQRKYNNQRIAAPWSNYADLSRYLVSNVSYLLLTTITYLFQDCLSSKIYLDLIN